MKLTYLFAGLLVAGCGTLEDATSEVAAELTAPGCGRMVAGQGLLPGQTFWSCDGRFRVVLQSDSNLVLYQGNTPLIWTSTVGKSAASAVMQGDGNFVLYGTSGQALWNTRTGGHPGAFLALQDDGNLVVYDTANRALWASNTAVSGTGVRPYQCASTTDAVFVSESALPARMEPSSTYDATVTFANCGSQTWTAGEPFAATGFKLGFDAPRDDDSWGASRVALPADVPPGHAVTIPVRLRASPLTGPREYRWAMVQEGVRWLSASSPLHTITVEATPRTATLCAGVSADVGGGASASAELQRCIDATPAGGVLEVPAGVYRITSELHFDKPMTLRTAGTASNGANCLDAWGPACAIFRADANLNVPRGFVRFGATTGVVLEHVVLDGNRGARLSSAAAATCAAGTNGAGFNARTAGCVGCSFLHGVSARALCGTGWEWVGDRATVTNCVFRDNGAHLVQSMYADGLTLLRSNGARVARNRFVDNSDVDLIFGGGTGATVSANDIAHRTQGAFAGLMLDNFNGSTSGDFTGTTVSDNRVNCGPQLCDFAIELGPHAWYLSANIIGGTLRGNSAFGGKFNINAEGAGTPVAPITLIGNTFGPAPAKADFLCGRRPTTAFNVSDSYVQLGAGQAAPTGSLTHHICP